MILAVDVGNIDAVFGCIENGQILDTVRVRTEAGATSAEAAVKIRDLLQLMSAREEDLDGAIIASVVPSATASLAEALKRLTGRQSLIVGPGIKTGLNVKIDDPATLGADLAVAAVAVIEYYTTPAIVIDMGTATTITLVDEKHCFRGGAIFPGVKLGFSALVSGTSLLPDIYIEKPKRCIGTSTVESMRSGAILGTASMIDGMIERMEEEFGKPCAHIATGGLAPSVVSCCRHEIVCDDNLLLKGLWAIYQKNSGRSR
ncbi:MAG: type III pantothenate kinase [Oscillospiraceae bacterium]|nr:type III pantothenate kinase [Oscillospiraceae bacterium]